MVVRVRVGANPNPNPNPNPKQEEDEHIVSMVGAIGTKWSKVGLGFG